MMQRRANVREKFRSLENSCIGNKNVKSTPFLDCCTDKSFASLGVRDVSGKFYQLASRLIFGASFCETFRLLQ